MSLKHLEAGSEFPKQEQNLRLYSMKYCPYAERSRLVLAAKRIPFETVNVNLVKKPEWFLARTPVGAVPVLEQNDGKILYESLIVCEYLDQIYPENRLSPIDPFEKARHQILIDAHFTKVVSAFYKLMRKTENAENDLNNALQYLEDNLNNNFFGGEKEKMIDYMLWPWFERLPTLKEFANYDLNPEKFPKLTTWIERMKQLPAVQEVIIGPEEYSKFYKGYMAGNAQYDFE